MATYQNELPRGVTIVYKVGENPRPYHCDTPMTYQLSATGAVTGYVCYRCQFKFTVPASGSWTEPRGERMHETPLSRSQARLLLREATEALERAEALLVRHGEDLLDGSVIRFQKVFPQRRMDAFPSVQVTHAGVDPDDFELAVQNAETVMAGAVFSYAAIRVNGIWYTTGPKSPKGYPWEELLSWLDDPVPSPRPIEVLSRGWSADFAEALEPIIADHVRKSLHTELHELLAEYATPKRIDRAAVELDELLTSIAAGGIDEEDQRQTLRGLFRRSVVAAKQIPALDALDAIMDRYHLPPKSGENNNG
jgi:hypothetical protein